MLGLVFTGRGGQGVVTASRVIGTSYFLEGYEVQDFPLYGAERVGAPVKAFVRVSKERILERGYIQEPDYVIILDESLGIPKYDNKPRLIINSRGKSGERVLRVDARSIASNMINEDYFNTVMCGATAAVLGLKKSVVVRAIREEIRTSTRENVECAKKGYDEMIKTLRWLRNE